MLKSREESQKQTLEEITGVILEIILEEIPAAITEGIVAEVPELIPGRML